MSRLLRVFNFLSWPLWLKFGAGFLVAIGVTTALLAQVARAGFAEISQQNIEAYLSENGAQRRDRIHHNLEEAGAELNSLLGDPTYSEPLEKVLQDPTSDAISSFTRLLQSRFFASKAYRAIRLLDAQGNVLIHTDARILLPTGFSEAQTVTFIEAQRQRSLGRDFGMVIFSSPAPTIEFVHAVVDAPTIALNRALGYLVVRLDNDTVLHPYLHLPNTAYEPTAYLVNEAEDPVVFSPSDTYTRARAAALNTPVIRQAFANQTGTAIYASAGSAENRVIGYYAPIPDPFTAGVNALALVVEVNANVPISQISDYFNSNRLFVLGLGLLVGLALLVVLFNQLFGPPLNRLRRAIQAMAQGNFNEPVTASARRGDEIGLLNTSFIGMREQVKARVSDLESRAAARARDIRATQEISRYAATQRDLQTLMDQVVQLIIEQFANIYHAQIFLIDSDNLYAELRASTGEAGRLLLERKHRLAVGSVSVIGQVTQRGEVVVARDTAASSVHRANEFLPHTRAELAIPLHLGERIMGALDVQSTQRDTFSEDEIAVLQTMADQVAIAIENARLYQESVQRLQEIERINQQAIRETWQEYIYGQRQRQLASVAGMPSGGNWSALRQRAMASGKIVTGETTERKTIPVAVPIQLRGQTLGAIEWELPADEVNGSKLQLAQELANRLAISLDNARLFEDSQRAAERERIVNTIAAKLTPQTEINEILQTAVREVGQALRAPQVSIRLHQTSHNGNGHDKPSNG